MKIFTLMSVLLMTQSFVVLSDLSAAGLIKESTIQTAKKLTKVYRLKNRIPVVYRQVPNSDILNITVAFHFGTKDAWGGSDLKPPVHSLLFDTMSMAAKGYPKKKLFSTVEKYAFGMGCSGGIEISTCSLNTVNDYWEEGLPLLAAVVKSPSITSEDMKLNRDRSLAVVKSQQSDPNLVANNELNKIFYPKDHPYFMSFDHMISFIPNVNRKQVVDWHSKILSAPHMYISVVGSLPAKALISRLDKHFGSIGDSKFKRNDDVPEPVFNKDKAFVFTPRDIPTAYIRVKFNGVSEDNPDAVAAGFLMRLLDEELGNEIRTKRSLSYSVYSYMIRNSIGIGVIGASTSKLRETMDAIRTVIRIIRRKVYTYAEFDEYKRIYATNYFLTQEGHNSLANALVSNLIIHGSADRLYDLPKYLDRVTPREIQVLANKLLKKLRISVVFKEKKFKKAWGKEFVDRTIK